MNLLKLRSKIFTVFIVFSILFLSIFPPVFVGKNINKNISDEVYSVFIAEWPIMDDPNEIEFPYRIEKSNLPPLEETYIELLSVSWTIEKSSGDSYSFVASGNIELLDPGSWGTILQTDLLPGEIYRMTYVVNYYDHLNYKTITDEIIQELPTLPLVEVQDYGYNIDPYDGDDLANHEYKININYNINNSYQREENLPNDSIYSNIKIYKKVFDPSDGYINFELEKEIPVPESGQDSSVVSQASTRLKYGKYSYIIESKYPNFLSSDEDFGWKYNPIHTEINHFSVGIPHYDVEIKNVSLENDDYTDFLYKIVPINTAGYFPYKEIKIEEIINDDDGQEQTTRTFPTVKYGDDSNFDNGGWKEFHLTKEDWNVSPYTTIRFTIVFSSEILGRDVSIEKNKDLTFRNFDAKPLTIKTLGIDFNNYLIKTDFIDFKFENVTVNDVQNLAFFVVNFPKPQLDYSPPRDSIINYIIDRELLDLPDLNSFPVHYSIVNTPFISGELVDGNYYYIHSYRDLDEDFNPIDSSKTYEDLFLGIDRVMYTSRNLDDNNLI